MISIKHTYKAVRKRLNHHKELKLRASERFVFVFGIVEKKIRRTLVYIWIKSGTGKTKDGAFKYLRNINSLNKFCNEWAKRDSNNRNLRELIGDADFEILQLAWNARDELFHGEGFAREIEYSRLLRKLVPVLDRMHETFEREYRYAGWQGLGS